MLKELIEDALMGTDYLKAIKFFLENKGRKGMCVYYIPSLDKT